MRSRVLSYLLMAVMLFGTLPVSAATVSDVTYTANGLSLPVPQAGEVTTSVTVEGEGEAQLIVALYNKEGRLVRSALSDKKTIASSEDLSAVLKIPNLDAYTLKYFVWDSASGAMKPYELPPRGNALTLSGESFLGYVTLKWKWTGAIEGTDYDIYCDGAKIATVQSGSYTYRAENGTYSYYIKCGSVVSNTVTVTATTDWMTALIKEASDVAHYAIAGAEEDTIAADDDDSDIEEGLTQMMWKGNDPQNTLVHIDDVTDASIKSVMQEKGVSWWAPGTQDDAVKHLSVTSASGVTKNAWFFTKYYRSNRKTPDTPNGHLYFVLDKNLTAAEASWRVMFEYLDTANFNTSLLYTTSSTDSSVAPTSVTLDAVTGTGTNEWKIGYFDIPATCFADEGYVLLSGASDFRFNANGGESYISRVAIINMEEAPYDIDKIPFCPEGVASYPDGASITASGGSETLSEGITFGYSAGDGTHTVADGYMSTVDRGAGYASLLYYNIDDTFIYGRKDNRLEVEVTYLDNVADVTMRMQYNSESDAYTNTRNIAMTGDGQEKTVVFELRDASFVNAQNGGSDIRFLLNSDDTANLLKIKKVTVRKVDFPVSGMDGDVTLYIAGDGIAAEYSANQSRGVVGWGMRLTNHLGWGAEVVNHASAGASTRTFGNMPTICTEADANDYVLISFGHKDAASGIPIAEYKENLKGFITQVRSGLATPIILNAVPTYERTSYTTDTYAAEEIEPYRTAAREAAEEMEVPFIDMAAPFRDKLSALPRAGNRAVWYVNEDVPRRERLTEWGAAALAEVISEELMACDEILTLKDYLK